MFNICVSLLYNANFGSAQDAFTNFPACLHYYLYSIVFLFGLCDCEDGFMKVGIKLFALRVILYHLEPLQHFVHHISCHLLSFHISDKLIFDCLKVLIDLYCLDICMFERHPHSISYL